jgi:hypothetical protein
MSESHPPQPTNSPPAKTRNPVERVLVWGFIGVLLVLAAIEFQSRSSHQKVLTALQDKIAEVDKNPSQPEVTEIDVKNALGNRKPDRTEEFGGAKLAPNGAQRLEVYTWFTLNPTSKRELWVWYGTKGKNATELATVIEVQGGELISEVPKATEVANSANDADIAAGARGMMGPPGNMPGGPGGRGMGGPGGPRGRPGAGGPAAHDADKPNGDAPDADKPDDKTTDDDKTDAATDEKADDKTDKADANNE